MRKLILLSTLAVVVALPVYARGKNESYISYDEGGTIVRVADDGREIDGRVNLPVFPGDEVITSRRGRAEVRLADGNVIGIDRSTAIRFRSVLDSYDGDANETVAELRYGKVAMYRSSDASESLRLDTQSASYFAGREAVFSVDADARGRDHLSVFDGSIEVRTPSRTSRVRAGESASVDDRGLYDLASSGRYTSDDFEQWFLRRAERSGSVNSRYLDRSLAYSDEDLSRNGTWTFMAGYGWGWRPYVSSSWRPYFYGQWAYSRTGCLTWVSYEPWGWVPYHYGRWSFDPIYGWYWLPGAAYAPAWVYWWYSPGYIGWAPAGWYDCYRPYYDWAYRPYAHAGIDFGFGFYGRVRVHEVDLRPWTFVDANTIMSNRVDRAAVSTDIVRGRLIREPGGGFATVSGTPARFNGNDRRDPGGAVNTIYRRGLGGGSGSGGGGNAGSPTDMTPFFRRDPEIGSTIRDRIVRTRPADSGGQTASRGTGGSVAPIGGGNVAPIGSGSLAPIGRGSVAPIGGGNVAPAGGGDGRVHRDDGGRIDRGTPAPTPRDNGAGRVNRGGDTPGTNRDTTTPTTSEPTWRNRVSRAFPGGIDSGDHPATPAPSTLPPRDENWRGRISRDEPSGSEPAAPAPAPRADRPRSVDRGSGSDVPRRVIDGIGGARISRDTPPPPRPPEARPPSHESSPPPARESSPPPARDSSPPPAEHHDSGGDKGNASRGEGGRVHRDKSD